jgi:very-short-patch-repair endonuclease
MYISPDDSKFESSYLGEDGWGRFRNEEVMKNLSAVVGKISELVLM